jgi:hypothetical protein
LGTEENEEKGVASDSVGQAKGDEGSEFFERGFHW